MAINFYGAFGSTGSTGSTLVQTTGDIGTPDNRLICVFVDDEANYGSSFQGVVTVGGVTLNQIQVANNTSGAGNHLELHTIHESALAGLSGSQVFDFSNTAGVTGNNWAIHVLVFTGVDSGTAFDLKLNQTQVGGSEITVADVDTPANGLVVMGAAHGGTASWIGFSSPLTERTNGPNPNSAVLATASGIEATAQTARSYTATADSTSTLRSCAIVATYSESGGTGGVTSNVAATWPLFSVSADQQSTAPSYDSTVATTWPIFQVNATQTTAGSDVDSTVAATWPMFSASADITAVVPNYTTDISATWPLFTISADQTSAQPAYSSDVSATWPLFSVTVDQESTLPSGATTVQVQWPMFGVAADQDSTVPAYSADVATTWPMFAIDATQDQTLPSGGATVAVEWPMFAVETSQDSTVPSYDSDVSATWPMFSISAISGEFDYRTDPQAKLALPFKSRKLTLPYQSRKIVL